MPETVASFAARNLLRHAVRRGIPSSVVSGWLGASPAELERSARVPAREVMSTWGRLRDELGDATLGVRVAHESRLADFGLFGFCVAAAPTLGAALATAVRYVALATDAGRWLLTERGGLVEAEWSRPGAPTEGRRISDEVMVGGLVRGIFELTGQRPRRVELVQRPQGARDYEGLLGCDVRFGSERTVVVLDGPSLAAAPGSANRELWRYLSRQADAEVARLRAGPLPERAEQIVAERLAAGGARPRLHEIARDLGLSERTLRRHLAREGAGFRALATRACLDHAGELLQGAGASCTEAALAAGYSDPSAFSRAWKKRQGSPPSKSRSRAR